MTVQICASVIARTPRDMERMMKRAERVGADLIEVRMDYFREKYNLKDIRSFSSLPLIATNRPSREGGLFEGSEEERIQLLSSAVDSEFELIDIELSTEGAKEIVQRIRDAGIETIISSHILNSTPNLTTLNLTLKKEMNTNANICKIVTSAKEFQDNLRCLRFVETAAKKTNVTCFCMGELGKMSRLISPLFGGYLTYASVEKDKESAPGQLTITEMRKFYEIVGV